MTEGRVLPIIVRFSLPILLANIFQQLYTVVDGIVVGKNISPQALAAVGAGFPVTYMLTSVFLGLGLGASVLIAQNYGNSDLDNVRRVAKTMNAFLLIVSLPLTILGIVSAGAFLNLLNVPEDIFSDAKLYMVVYYLGLLPQFGYNVNASVLQGIGDSKSPLNILIISSILHIALAFLFVVVIPWGVAGVAFSTVFSQLVSWVLSIIVIKRKYNEIAVPTFSLKIDRHSFVQVLKVGLPIGFQNALFSVGMMVMQPLINSYGYVFIAGYNAAIKVDGFVFIPVTSLAAAVTTFVGQNIGAKKLDRVKEGFRATMWLAMGLCVLMCAIVIPLRSQLMYLFTDQSAVVSAGNEYLIRVIPLYFLSTIQFMYVGVLRGAGQSLVPTIATMLSLWLARVPAAFLLSSWFGAANMHWCYPIGWVLGLAILIPYYYLGKWKRGIAT